MEWAGLSEIFFFFFSEILQTCEKLWELVKSTISWKKLF